MPPGYPTKVDTQRRQRPMSKNESEQTAVWDWNTGVPGLVRHLESGRYYSRFQLNGKRTMKALKTDSLSVAKAKHFEKLAEAERHRQMGARAEAGTAKLAEIFKLALA